MNWFVVSVKANQEKKVAEVLEKMNVEVYCPMVKDSQQFADKTKTVKTPLFKSYVFVNLPEKYRGIVFGAPGVISYLFWLGKPAVISDEEINIIKNWEVNNTNNLLELTKRIPDSDIDTNNQLLKNTEGVIQWSGKRNKSFLLKEMKTETTVSSKLKNVI